MCRQAAGEIRVMSASALAFPPASYLVSNRDRMAELSGRDSALLHPPLRTVHASFPAYSSSLCKALFDQSQQPTFLLGYGVACDSSDVVVPSCSCCRHRLELLEGRDEDSIPYL